MKKLEILKERLEECNTSIQEIEKIIMENIDYECSIFVYISRFDDIGNKDSDFDIYVIGKKENNQKEQMYKIKEAKCDIEFCSVESIKQLLYKEDNYNIGYLKFLKRLISSTIIFSNDKDINSLINIIEEKNIDNLIFNYFKVAANSEYDDAVNMYRNNDYICSLSCCYRAVDYLLAAINSKNGKSVCNVKWAPKLMIDNNGYGNSMLVKDYLKLFVYNEVNDKNLVFSIEKMLKFFTENVNQFSKFLW